MIERIETSYYRLPFQFMSDPGRSDTSEEELITVKLHAYGLVGHGYAYTWGQGGHAIQTLIQYDLAGLLDGRDAADVEQLWDDMREHCLFIGHGGLMNFAISAVDIALWDIRGQMEGKPLYALLGASPRMLPIYGSSADLDASMEELLDRVGHFMEEGLPGVEVKVGYPELDKDEKRVKEVRRMIGPETDLMVDANMAWNPYQALVHGQRLQPFRPAWFEEPTRAEDVTAHHRLAEVLEVPIAVGECLNSPYEFQRFVDEEAADILQIDPAINGGVTGSLKALAIADAAGVKTTCHYADTLGIHLLCAAGKPIYMEKHLFTLDRFLESPQPLKHGRARPVEVAGTGLRFSEADLEQYRVTS